MGKDQHVTPHPNGGWQVKGAGNSRATVRTNTQREAINIGREISRNQGSELLCAYWIPGGMYRGIVFMDRSWPMNLTTYKFTVENVNH